MNDDSAYVTEKRIKEIKQDYIVITTGETIPSRTTFNVSDPRVNDMLAYIRVLRDIGKITYDSNVTGYDFEIFLLKA